VRSARAGVFTRQHPPLAVRPRGRVLRTLGGTRSFGLASISVRQRAHSEHRNHAGGARSNRRLQHPIVLHAPRRDGTRIRPCWSRATVWRAAGVQNWRRPGDRSDGVGTYSVPKSKGFLPRQPLGHGAKEIVAAMPGGADATCPLGPRKSWSSADESANAAIHRRRSARAGGTQCGRASAAC